MFFTKPLAVRVCMAAGLLALGGCTETLVGFAAEYSSNMYSAVAGPPAGKQITVTLRKNESVAGNRAYVRPRQAILKLNGFLPVQPDEVSETASGFVVRFTLPEDLVKPAQSKVYGPQIWGELLLPVETGIVSFTGLEHFTPGTVHLGVSLTPVYAGPLTNLAGVVREFLRGLYAAR